MVNYSNNFNTIFKFSLLLQLASLDSLTISLWQLFAISMSHMTNTECCSRCCLRSSTLHSYLHGKGNSKLKQRNKEAEAEAEKKMPHVPRVSLSRK